MRLWNPIIMVMAALFAAASPAPAGGDEKPFRNDVITQVEIGEVPAGRYALRATITTVQPHAKIPYHLHEHNGLRYMLEGALSISWKNGEFQTYSAGSTYFEGPGANHPEKGMAAANPLDTVTKVLIIELVALD